MANKQIRLIWLEGETGLTINVHPANGSAPYNATLLEFEPDDDEPNIYYALMTEAAAGVGLIAIVYQNGEFLGDWLLDLVETDGIYPLQGSPSSGQIAASISGNTPTISYIVPPAIENASQEANLITCVRGDSFSRDIILGTITGWSKVTFTAKRKPASDLDADAVLQVVVTSGGGSSGLIRLNGAAATAGNGSITINDASTGDITLALVAATVAALAVESIFWDAQVIFSDGRVSTPRNGKFSTTIDVTIATT